MTDTQSVAADQIRSIVERVEKLADVRKDIAADIAEVYAEARSNGFDVKALKAIIAMRAKDPAERTEHEAIVELYKQAMEML